MPCSQVNDDNLVSSAERFVIQTDTNKWKLNSGPGSQEVKGSIPLFSTLRIKELQTSKSVTLFFLPETSISPEARHKGMQIFTMRVPWARKTG
jgi:hypothetical protein